jgi:hypothetical protein
MAIATDWKVLAARPQPDSNMTVTGGVPDERFDLTPYIKGLDFVQEIEYGQLGSGVLTMTLENSTGGFTPQQYDDEFAYDSDRFYNNGLNWFDTWLVYLQGFADTGPGTTLASQYALIPTDVDFTDDGYQSTITVTAMDYTVWLERNALAELAISGANSRVVLNTLLEQHTQAFGANEYDIPIPPSGVQIEYGDTDLTFPDGVSVAEVWAQIAANEELLIFPVYVGSYFSFPFISTTLVSMIVRIITTESLYRSDDVLRFSDPSTIAAGRDDGLGGTIYDLLPFRDLQFGTTTDRLTTQAHMANSSAVSSTSTNTTSTATYGTRGARFSDLPPTIVTSGTQQDYLDEKALTLTTWWDTVENYVEGIEISEGMVEQFCDDDALTSVQRLFQDGLFFVTLIDILGAGGTNTQASNTFLRSVLSITPRGWVIRLERGIGSTSGFGLRLDDEEIGVLDENRVGAPTRR